MTPTDPRHGSEAGYEQHLRDGDQPCEACRAADLTAARRRGKRRTMGHVYTRPVGEQLLLRLAEFQARGCTHEDIATAAGIASSQAWRIIHGGPDARVYARTWAALDNVRDLRVLTAVGATRRVRAMVAVGYSYPVIAEAAGVDRDTVRDAAVSPQAFSSVRVRQSLADTYDRLAMRPRVGDRYVQAGATRARNIAARNGWHTALAWDDQTIDDPRSTPDVGGDGRDGVDDVTVERLLAGWRVESTRPEREEAMRRWLADGGSARALCRMHGWQEGRYSPRQAGAA